MRVQDSSSGRLLPVWQTLKGLSQHDTGGGTSSTSSQDPQQPSSSPPPSRLSPSSPPLQSIWTLSQNVERMESARGPTDGDSSGATSTLHGSLSSDHETVVGGCQSNSINTRLLPNGLLPLPNSPYIDMDRLPQPPPPPPYIRLAPSSPVATPPSSPPYTSLPSKFSPATAPRTLLSPSVSYGQSNTSGSLKCSTSPSQLSPVNPLSSSSICSGDTQEVTISIPSLSSSMATSPTESSCNNLRPERCSLPYAFTSSSAGAGNTTSNISNTLANHNKSLSVSNQNNSLSIANNSGADPGTRRSSRNNSIAAILPTFPIPSATQLSNTAALGDIATPGPESPNVFSGLFFNLYRYTGAGKKTRKRIVQKNGECNVSVANVAKRRRRYLQDIFTTLVDIKWRWTLMVFAMSFLLSWLGFAVVWWLIALLHGDLDKDHMPEFQETNRWTPCVINIVSFTSCFLFSIETQHTIGYGSRHTTEQCPHAIVVMCLQSITGVMIQAFMVGIVFAKLSRPKKRTQTLIFSRNMCILQRDGERCLIFRVGDLRKSHIIEAHVRAQLIRKHVTQEGEEIPLFMYDLDVGYDVGLDRIFFIWPMTIVHKINEGSPLYDLSAKDLKTEEFEIVVLLEGVIESTGMTTQARSSYLPDEILWGHRFEPLVNYKKGPREGFSVDLSLFNITKPVNTPLCSARELDERGSNGSSAGSCDEGGKDEGEGHEEEEGKEADGTSSHSSQVTSLGPLSPHSDCTVAAAPLLSPSSHGNLGNNNKQEDGTQSAISGKEMAATDGNQDPSRTDTFIYDLNHLRDSGLLREGVRVSDPSARHTIAFSCDEAPSRALGADADVLQGAYRRTISLPHKRDYVQDNNRNYCIQDKETHRNGVTRETPSELDRKQGKNTSSRPLECGSNLLNIVEPSSNAV